VRLALNHLDLTLVGNCCFGGLLLRLRSLRHHQRAHGQGFLL
jgi:hypothetical protein